MSWVILKHCHLVEVGSVSGSNGGHPYYRVGQCYEKNPCEEKTGVGARSSPVIHCFSINQRVYTLARTMCINFDTQCVFSCHFMEAVNQTPYWWLCGGCEEYIPFFCHKFHEVSQKKTQPFLHENQNKHV